MTTSPGDRRPGAVLPIIAGLVGATAVAMGAFGAHGLRGLVTPRSLEVWNTAARYHLVHAVVLLVLVVVAARGTGRWPTAAFTLICVGIALFSGSLYAMVLSDQRWLGAITPLGGLCLIGGWILAGIAIAKRG